MPKPEGPVIDVADISSEHVQKPHSYFEGIARGIVIGDDKTFAFYLRSVKDPKIMVYVTDDGSRGKEYPNYLFRKLISIAKTSEEENRLVVICGEVLRKFPDSFPPSERALLKAEGVERMVHARTVSFEDWPK